jgi:hypothetical protein
MHGTENGLPLWSQWQNKTTTVQPRRWVIRAKRLLWRHTISRCSLFVEKQIRAWNRLEADGDGHQAQ